MGARRMRVGAWVLLALFAGSVAAFAAPTEATDPIDFYVHQCLVNADGLPHYEALIDARLAEGRGLLQGEHGPVDGGCCVTLEAATVSAFGVCGDGFDHITSGAEVAALFASAPGAYLVDTVHFCGGVASTGIRGCAEQPGDVLIVGREADDNFFLDEVIAHERGHNAGLGHVSANACELMSDASGGGCLTSLECAAYTSQASGTGGSCACLPDVFGDAPASNGTACLEQGGFEVCSGGTCEGPAVGPHLQLWLAAGPGAANGLVTDERLAQDVRHGSWSATGGFGGGVELSGLAYDPNRHVVFGLERKAGNDGLVTLHPVTGQRVTVAPLGFDGLEALAYDPNEDWLYAAQVDAEIFGNPHNCGAAAACITELLRIHPVTLATTALGELNTYIVPDGVTGLAFDSKRGLLYLASEAGLARVDPDDCTGVLCTVTLVDTVFRNPASLAYNGWTDELVRQGSVLGRSEIDHIDAATGARRAQTRIDAFTAGGSTVLPLPEPGGFGWGVALVLVLARSRRDRARIR